MRAATVSEKSASEAGLGTVEPRLNGSAATPSKNVAREMLAAADRSLRHKIGMSLHGSVAWLLGGYGGRIMGVPGSRAIQKLIAKIMAQIRRDPPSRFGVFGWRAFG
jgi:hypothetical protein